MRYTYIMVDSRDRPVARVTSDDSLDATVWRVFVNDSDRKAVLSHEYVTLMGVNENVAPMEGRICKCDGNLVTIEPVRQLGNEVRNNLRMPVRFSSFLYPVTGTWKGRAPILSNDLSCGGVAFFCAWPLEVGEIAEVVIPITSAPLVLTVRILRQRPSGEPIPLYAAAFVDMVHEEEVMVREAVFGLQLRSASAEDTKEG